MIAVIDFGAGNLASVTHALDNLGVAWKVVRDPGELDGAEKVIFPGVGEAETAMKVIRKRKLDQALRELEVPLLGICLGMQLMYDFSFEGNVKCLGMIRGEIRRFSQEPDSQLTGESAGVPERKTGEGEPAPGEKAAARSPGGLALHGARLKVPQIGWNQVRIVKESRLFHGVRDGEYYYFVHSYYAPLSEHTIGETEYGIPFSSAFQRENLLGVQFHPEKSGEAGMRLLRNFAELC